MPLINLAYLLATEGKLAPYSEDGFFDICPFSEAGTSYPTGLGFSENTTYPAAP